MLKIKINQKISKILNYKLKNVLLSIINKLFK